METTGPPSPERPDEERRQPVRVRQFRILDTLGRGGMGEVYVAFDETLERKVALKAIRLDRRLSPAARARFLREARVLSKLDHPNICRIHDYVTDVEGDFLVLELIEGRDLNRAIAEGLTRPAKLAIAERIADALVAAHAAGVVHRDLKPTNVMLTASGEVRVLDFGLARASGGPTETAVVEREEERPSTFVDASVTATSLGETSPSDWTEVGAVVGTPQYMSPEQARGEPATPASDMYSFGLLLQSLFTERPPYEPEISPARLIERARRGEPAQAIGLGRELGDLVARLESFAPTRRPTAIEAVERLRSIRGKPRRRLRNLAIAAGFAVAILGAAKYTLDLGRERAAAVAARAEAERRRAQAEDFIGFMLGDLRERLEPVGRLDVLDAVGDKALQYFADLTPEERARDDELYRRSKALVQIGEVRLAQGALPKALDAFRQSLDLAEELARRDPRNGAWQLQLGAAQFWIGQVLLTEGRLHEAVAPFSEYLAIAERLVTAEPQNADYQLELAYAHTNLGGVQSALGAESALDSIRKSIEIKRQLVATDPDNEDWQRSLANGLSWLASVLEARGEIEPALVQYREELALRTALVAADPRAADDQSLLAISHNHIADVLRMLGRVEEARAHLQADLEVQSTLVGRDPANADWQLSLAMTRSGMGRLLLSDGRLEEADAMLRAAGSTVEELLKKDGNNRDWLTAKATVQLERGQVSLAAARPHEALRQARATLAILTPLLADDPEEGKRRSFTCRAHLLQGLALVDLGRPAEARAAGELALDTIEANANGSRNPAFLEPWARVLVHVGRREEAVRVVGVLAGMGYREPGFRKFCEKMGLPLGDA